LLAHVLHIELNFLILQAVPVNNKLEVFWPYIQTYRLHSEFTFLIGFDLDIFNKFAVKVK